MQLCLIQKEKDKLIHVWEDEGIRVEKARWGRHNVIKGKQKVEPKLESLSVSEIPSDCQSLKDIIVQELAIWIDKEEERGKCESEVSEALKKRESIFEELKNNA